MRQYRKRERTAVTKYSPIFRDELGYYQKEEWTAMSDVGKIYDGKIFTYEEYLEAEAKYVNAVFLTMDFFKSKQLTIKHIFKLKNLKKVKRFKDEKLYKNMLCFNADDVIEGKDEIEHLVKLRLREYIGELEVWVDKRTRTEILFGFDYYMYIKTNRDITELCDEIEKNGLYTT